jgi:hypothetical protein
MDQGHIETLETQFRAKREGGGVGGGAEEEQVPKLISRLAGRSLEVDVGGVLPEKDSGCAWARRPNQHTA